MYNLIDIKISKDASQSLYTYNRFQNGEKWHVVGKIIN